MMKQAIPDSSEALAQALAQAQTDVAGRRHGASAQPPSERCCGWGAGGAIQARRLLGFCLLLIDKDRGTGGAISLIE